MQETPIGWTDFSLNLIKYRDATGKTVWACVHASTGCINCYAQALALRWNKGKLFTAQNMEEVTPFFDEVEATRVLTSKKIKGKRVFVNDMTDWMGPWVSDEIIDSCVAVFAARPDAIFQTLTKHADRQQKYFADSSLEDRITELWQGDDPDRQTWNVMQPLDNLHIGVSVEDQKNANIRIIDLINTLAAIKWISAEPFLGAIDLTRVATGSWAHGLVDVLSGYLCGEEPDELYDWKADPDGWIRKPADEWERGELGIDWIVLGGESGSGHRTMALDAAVEFIRSAKASGVPIFVKQDSGPRPGMQGRIPDQLWLKEFPIAA